jgi:AcrR family transcriptional regulator
MDDLILTKGQRTRKAVLDAAYSLFLEQGYTATSMRDISMCSGLALGGIYNHFKSKEEIFSEVILERHPFFEVLPLLHSSPGDTAEEFIRVATHRMVEELGRRPEFIKLLFVELVEFKGRNLPRMFEAIYPQIPPLLNRFTGSKGEFKEIPLLILFRAFLGLFFSYYMTEFLLAGTPVLLEQENALDHFVNIFLHGALAEKDNP